ncbi:CaiB/BaiF CoA transferase family protein [Asanoa iriomotensis]|uniref:CoA transferase n=1 Tax=Asanoa iriomotensis TaxID=234613 RepID=A0ABQ4BZ62_9ACTN|nr:CoA transferase [Asanoa iriomotensis]GIF55813.1 CoA transferase [Asanoa iriomotensis]
MTLPLSDIRIVAVEQYGAGPYGSMHLADLGADVIKVEQPPDGDVGRYVPPYRDGTESLFFESLNRNKRSVCLDIAHPRGRGVFEDLVARSDAVFYNLRGDVPAKLGLRYADLKGVNPRVVCCSLSGYGMTGPRAAEPGFDYMVQGVAGWMSITGEPDGPPTKTGMSAVDFATGLAAALSLMVGVHAARRDGAGGDADVALLDTAVSMLNYLATWHLTRGHVPRRVERSGHPTLVPFGNFPTADGWIVAGGSKEKFWVRMTEAFGRPDLATDPRFATFDDRLRHRDEIIGVLDAEFAKRPTAEWLTLLTARGVPCAPINDIGAALADPQVVARDLVFRTAHPKLGPVGQVASPVRFGDTAPLRRRGPSLGEHTREILAELLGYTDDHIAELVRAGAVRERVEP